MKDLCDVQNWMLNSRLLWAKHTGVTRIVLVFEDVLCALFANRIISNGFQCSRRQTTPYKVKIWKCVCVEKVKKMNREKFLQTTATLLFVFASTFCPAIILARIIFTKATHPLCLIQLFHSHCCTKWSTICLQKIRAEEKNERKKTRKKNHTNASNAQVCNYIASNDEIIYTFRCDERQTTTRLHT